MAVKTSDVLSLSQSKNRTIWMLAWPAIIEQVLFTMVNYIDTAMVGSLGPDATAAVGINSSPTWIIFAVMSVVAIGYSILIAQKIGAKEIENAKELIRQTFFPIIAFSIFFLFVGWFLAPHIPLWMGIEQRIAPMASGYLTIMIFAIPFQFCSFVFSSILRSAGDTVSPMILNICTNVMNVILNSLFIFKAGEINLFGISLPGLGWGVKGAATASAISIVTTGTVLTLLMFLKNYDLKISLKDKFQFDYSTFKSAMKIGIPAGFERMTVTLGQVAQTRIVASLGTASLAAHTLANTAESMCYLPAVGFQHAATTLVSQSMGAEKHKDAYQYGIKATKMGIYSMLVLGTLLFVFSKNLISLFTPSAEVIMLGATILKIVAFAQPMSATSSILSGALRGVGETKYPFVVSVIGMWGIRIPLSIISVYIFGFGINALWVAMTLDLITRGVLTLLRFRQRNWYQRT